MFGRRNIQPPWKEEWKVLATYNSEKIRGILHSEEWVKTMKAMQKDYDDEMVAWAKMVQVVVISA